MTNDAKTFVSIHLFQFNVMMNILTPLLLCFMITVLLWYKNSG